jgi:hypothetical protein
VPCTAIGLDRRWVNPMRDHQSPETHARNVLCGRALSYPLMGLRRSFPTANAIDVRIAPVRSHPCLRQMLLAPRRRPFSVLMGLMPCLTRPASEARAGLGSLSEVLHRP